MTDELDTRLREALRDLRPPPADAAQRARVRAAVRAAAGEAEPRPRPRRPFGLLRRPPFGLLLRRPVVRLGLAAAVMLAAFAAVALFGPAGGKGPETVSAAQVMQRALMAWSSGRTLQADVELTIVEWDMWAGTHKTLVDRYHLSMQADGSYRLTLQGRSQTGVVPTGGTPSAEDVVYSARTGTLSAYSRDRGLLERLGYPPGPPDRWAGIITDYDFSAGARALEAARGAKLEVTTYEDRPAWVVTCSLASGSARPAVTQASPLFKITIDQATSWPVRFQAIQDDLVYLDVRYSHLRVDEPLPDRVFALTPPSDAAVTRVNEGFRRVELTEACAATGYTALVPDVVPERYELAQAAVAPSSATANRLVEGRRVFVLQYTRGFDGLTLTTRRVTDPEYVADTDPFEPEPGWAKLMRREVRLRSGAFAGATAMLVVAPKITTPHLWAVKDGVLLTVAGGATGQELVELAESLHVLDH